MSWIKNQIDVLCFQISGNHELIPQRFGTRLQCYLRHVRTRRKGSKTRFVAEEQEILVLPIQFEQCGQEVFCVNDHAAFIRKVA